MVYTYHINGMHIPHKWYTHIAIMVYTYHINGIHIPHKWYTHVTYMVCTYHINGMLISHIWYVHFHICIIPGWKTLQISGNEFSLKC